MQLSLIVQRLMLATLGILLGFVRQFNKYRKLFLFFSGRTQAKSSTRISGPVGETWFKTNQQITEKVSKYHIQLLKRIASPSICEFEETHRLLVILFEMDGKCFPAFHTVFWNKTSVEIRWRPKVSLDTKRSSSSYSTRWTFAWNVLQLASDLSRQWNKIFCEILSAIKLSF